MIDLINIHKDGYIVYCTVQVLDMPDIEDFEFGYNVKTKQIVLNGHNEIDMFTRMASSGITRMYMEYENLPSKWIIRTH